MDEIRILDAAEGILCESGAEALELCVVAQRSKVPVDQVRTRYSDKGSLLRSLVARLVEEFDAVLDSYGGSGSTRAYVETTFSVIMGPQELRMRKRWGAIIDAASVEDALQPLSAAMTRWHNPPSCGRTTIEQIVRLAAAGLWDAGTLARDAYYAPANLEALRDRLLGLLPD